MANETQFGTMEAFSFRKGVVKISGKWIRFGPEAESAIKALSKGDSVSYVVEAGNLKRIQKVEAKQPTAAPVTVAAPAKAQATPAQAKPENPANPSFQDRNKSIERQVALKAAVELAGLYGYKSTKECLDVAASFAAWIEAGNPGDIQFPPNGHAYAGIQRTTSSVLPKASLLKVAANPYPSS